MFAKIRRLFIIKTRFEACLVIYALAVGGVERGAHYLNDYPGVGGWLLLLACTGTVMMAGAKVLDCIKFEQAARADAAKADANETAVATTAQAAV